MMSAPRFDLEDFDESGMPMRDPQQRIATLTNLARISPNAGKIRKVYLLGFSDAQHCRRTSDYTREEWQSPPPLTHALALKFRG